MIGLMAAITSHSLTGAFRRVKFRIWSLNLSTDRARGMAYKLSGLALVVRLWAAIRSPLPRLILYPRNSNPSLTCTMPSRFPRSIHHHSCFEKTADQSQHRSITDLLADQVHQAVLVNAVKIGF